MRTRLALAAGTAALALVGSVFAASPAMAATSGSTDVTFNLAGGSLSINAPSAVTINGSIGAPVSGAMGTTTVTDNTGALAGWNVTAATGSNTMASVGTPADTIALNPALPALPPLSIVTGPVAASGASILSGVAAGTGGSLTTTPVTLVTAASLAGGGVYTYNPTLALVVPANTVAHSDYKVTVTQTVV
jgi:hypothetical protein